METTAKRYLWVFFAILLIILAGAYLMNLINAPQSKPLGDNQSTPSYYTVRDEAGNVILETGVPIQVDDIWISDQNQHYQVTRVERDQAWAALKTADNSPLKSMLKPDSLAAQPVLGPSIPVQTPPQDIHVVIYHSQ